MLVEGVEVGRSHSLSGNYGSLHSGNFGNIATAFSVGSMRKPWVKCLTPGQMGPAGAK